MNGISDVTRVGFVGTGSMGEPMVERLLAAGYQVQVFARREEVIARLSAQGAEMAASLNELGAFADIVVLCMFSDAQVREVTAGDTGVIAGMRPGTTLVNHTTGSPSIATDLLRLTAARGASYVEAPVSGTAAMIRDGRLTVLLAGEDSAVDRVEGVVRAYAQPVIPTGAVGSAMAIKLINNVLFAAQSQLARAAVRAGQAMGVAPDRLQSTIAEMSGGSTALRYLRPGAEARATSEHYLRKDVGVVAAVAHELDIDIDDLLAAAYRGELELAYPATEPAG